MKFFNRTKEENEKKQTKTGKCTNQKIMFRGIDDELTECRKVTHANTRRRCMQLWRNQHEITSYTHVLIGRANQSVAFILANEKHFN